jgi:hypothetical protein
LADEARQSLNEDLASLDADAVISAQLAVGRDLPRELAQKGYSTELRIGGADARRFLHNVRYSRANRRDRMATHGKEKNAAIVAIRWSARILGLVMAGFLLFMFLGYFLEGRSPVSDSLTPSAAIGLTLMGIYIFAMLLALKWERAGLLLGAIALGCFFVIMFLGLLPGNVSGGFSAKGVLNPVLLALWLPISLYLLCAGLERRGAS